MTSNGTWKSHSGSTLKITENNGLLSGTFHRGKEQEGVEHPVTGSIDPDDSPNVRPLSFSVSWYDKSESFHTVTIQALLKGGDSGLEAFTCGTVGKSNQRVRRT